MLKFTFIFSLFIVSSLASKCPDGFKILNNSKCYKFFERPATYSDANAHCNQLGGGLISIQSSVENNEIALHTTSTFFIGLKCNSSSYCHWEDGIEPNFINFHLPDGKNNGECVTMQIGSGYWFNTPCDEPQSYVCEVKQETCQYTFDDYCYNPHTTALSESDAEQVCQQECGHLVSIHSNDENTYVRRLFDASIYNYIRIGAIYQNNTNSWTDNSSWSYQNIGYQNANFGSCYSMALTNDVVGAGKWISSQCQKTLPFVCKMEPCAQCGPTPSPTLAPSQCNGPQFMNTEDYGYIYSPNYPLSYDGLNNSCTYILSTPLGTTTMISFPDFDVDPSSTFALYNSIEDEDPFVVFDYWNAPNGTYSSTSNTMKLVFYSNYFALNNDTYLWSALFRASQSQLSTTPSNLQSTSNPATTACGTLSYYVPPTTIMYPGDSGSMPSDYKCIYSIETTYGSRIKISFTYLNMYSTGGSLVIYDGAYTSSPVLVTLQKKPTGWYNSTSNNMLLFLTLSSSYDNFSADVRIV